MKRQVSAYSPLVSVIVPVYNCYRYLDKCLDSLIGQTYSNIEIICVEDCSQDSSFEILKFYEKKDTRLKVCRHLVNQGQSGARNTGLDMARGDYVCFIDGDDVLITSAISKMIDAIRDENADICLFNMEMFFPDGSVYLCYPESLFETKKAGSQSCLASVAISNAVLGLYNRAVCFSGNKNRFTPNVDYEDWRFMSELLNSSNLQLCFVNEPLYKYRRGVTPSVTNRISDKVLNYFDAYESSVISIYKNPNALQLRDINDKFFVEGVLSFFISKIMRSEGKVKYLFIERMQQIFKGYPRVYLRYLCNDLCKDRLFLVKLLLVSDMSPERILEEYLKYLKVIDRKSAIQNCLRGIWHWRSKIGQFYSNMRCSLVTFVKSQLS